jgi:hypothetical protein
MLAASCLSSLLRIRTDACGADTVQKQSVNYTLVHPRLALLWVPVVRVAH